MDKIDTIKAEAAQNERYMARCLQLAKLGRGLVSPNPMVGAVIVCDDTIIGEGYHHCYGGPHAEVNAINAVRDSQLLKKSTLYVSLEPCSHHGKTPPCSELIIKKQIPRVVVGCVDPYAAVSGRGINQMRQSGVEVVVGVLEQESLALNTHFITAQNKNRPYVILKWAQSADGFIDVLRGGVEEKPILFSTPLSQVWTHRLRTEVDAIWVGTNTALLDNPALTSRRWCGRSPLRIVSDRQLRLPSSLQLLCDQRKTWVITEQETSERENVDYITCPPNKCYDLWFVLNKLQNRHIQSVLVEGGAQLHNAFLTQGCWDEIRVEVAPFCLGQGIKAPNIENGIVENVETEEQRTFLLYKNKQNRVVLPLTVLK